jgi:hypothetical protein
VHFNTLVIEYAVFLHLASDGISSHESVAKRGQHHYRQYSD